MSAVDAGCQIAAAVGDMYRRHRENLLQESPEGRERGSRKSKRCTFCYLCCYSGGCVCVQLDPKRLKKDLLKALKLIKGEDRVLIVGTTKDPQSAELKSFCKMYSKIILIPRPDYGSRCSRGEFFIYFLI